MRESPWPELSCHCTNKKTIKLSVDQLTNHKPCQKLNQKTTHFHLTNYKHCTANAPIRLLIIFCIVVTGCRHFWLLTIEMYILTFFPLWVVSVYCRPVGLHRILCLLHWTEINLFSCTSALHAIFLLPKLLLLSSPPPSLNLYQRLAWLFTSHCLSRAGLSSFLCFRRHNDYLVPRIGLHFLFLSSPSLSLHPPFPCSGGCSSLHGSVVLPLHRGESEGWKTNQNTVFPSGPHAAEIELEFSHLLSHLFSPPPSPQPSIEIPFETSPFHNWWDMVLFWRKE